MVRGKLGGAYFQTTGHRFNWNLGGGRRKRWDIVFQMWGKSGNNYREKL